PEFGLANPCSICEHGFKHWPKIARRAPNNFKHLRSCRLLLQRFRKVTGALPQLVEQPRVLDGDYSLGGEILDECDLLVGEGATKLRAQKHNTDYLVFLQ